MGKVDIQTGSPPTTITLAGDTGDVTIGGGGQHGNLLLKSGAGAEMIRIGSKMVQLGSSAFSLVGEIVVLDGAGGELARMGGLAGDVTLRDNGNHERISLQSQSGDVIIKNASDVEVIRLNGSGGNVAVGGGGQDGDIKVRDSANKERVRVGSAPAKIELLDSAGSARIKLDGDVANVSIGGGQQGGDLILQDVNGTERLRLEGSLGVLTFKKPNGSPTVRVDGDVADVVVGGVGEGGSVVLKTGLGDARIRLDAAGGTQATEFLYLDGASGTITCGGSVMSGTVVVKSAAGKNTISLSGSAGAARVGGNGAAGMLLAFPDSGDNVTHGQATVKINANDASVSAGAGGKTGRLVLQDGAAHQVVIVEAGSADLVAGCKGRGANVFLVPASSSAESTSSAQASLHLSADDGAIRAGSAGKNGVFLLRNAGGKEIVRIASGPSDASSDCAVHINGNDGAVRVGSAGKNGVFVLRNAGGKEIVRIASGPSDASSDCAIHISGNEGTIRAGAGGKDGKIIVRNKAGAESVRVDGETGDVVLQNADCAEEFDTVAGATFLPGSVLVIGDDERLTLATEAYDRRVAGVVSGAGSCRPGIVLGRRHDAVQRPAIALVGKVYCLVDASHGAIRVGDLLVSSPTPGHAMAAADAARTPGAVLGKALRACPDGKQLIPILVSLQ